MDWYLEKKFTTKNAEEGGQVIQRCQLTAADYLPSIHTNSSSVFNKMPSVVSEWRDKSKMNQSKQIRGFSFPEANLKKTSDAV